MSGLFNLFCYRRGDAYRHVFGVKIGEDETVAALKKAIKEKCRPDFDHIPADSLILWSVSVPFNSSLYENVERLNLVEDKSLQLLDTLQDVFPSALASKTVHIVVEPPSPSRLFCSVYGEGAQRMFVVEIGEDEIVSALKKAIKEKGRTLIISLPSPSSYGRL